MSLGTVRIVAPAKVNLRLKILSQQTNGYHSLESVFCAISLYDEITIEPGNGDVQLEVEGDVDVGPIEDNLVVRAARRFFLAVGHTGDGVRIQLRKVIPSAAGLGGGSSDAAATLIGLNALLDRPLSAAELLRLGGELGSDVPFFLCGSPLAIGWGRGERLLALRPLRPRPVLVAHPDVRMPTGQAFQRIAELRGGGYAPPALAFSVTELESWEGTAALAENDFDVAAAERVAIFEAGRQAMRDGGAQIALLSGSGSALFGLFPDGTDLDSLEVALDALGFRSWRAETLRAMPALSQPERGDRG